MYFDGLTISIMFFVIATLIVAEIPFLQSRKKTRFYLMVCTSFITIWLNNEKERKNEITQKTEKIFSDSVNQRRNREAIDSAVSRQTASFGEAIGKYGLKLDSGLNGVKTLVRTLPKGVNDYGVDPHFGLCLSDNGLAPSTIEFKKYDEHRADINLKFCAENSGVKSIDVNAVVIAFKGNVMAKFDPLIPITWPEVQPGIATENTITCDLYGVTSDTIYIYTFGTYKNSLGNKKYRLDNLVGYNTKTKQEAPYIPVLFANGLKKMVRENMPIRKPVK